MNLKYMKASLFEISKKKKKTFSRFYFFLRCTCKSQIVARNINTALSGPAQIVLGMSFKMECWSEPAGNELAHLSYRQYADINYI